MPQKGELKAPVAPLRDALERAMNIIDGYGCTVAIFMIGGKVSGTKTHSLSFANRLRLNGNLLVGVYDPYVDARMVEEDLAVFYSTPSRLKVTAHQQ